MALEHEYPGKTAPVDWSTVDPILYGARLHRKPNLLQRETRTHENSLACPKYFWTVSDNSVARTEAVP